MHEVTLVHQHGQEGDVSLLHFRERGVAEQFFRDPFQHLHARCDRLPGFGVAAHQAVDLQVVVVRLFDDGLQGIVREVGERVDIEALV